MENPLTLLQQFIVEHYDPEELRLFCVGLSINYDMLPGDNQQAKTQELILRLGHQRRLGALVSQLRQMRRQAYDKRGPSSNPATLHAALPVYEAGVRTYTPPPPPPPQALPEPGPLPLGAFLPFERNPFFTGRIGSLQVLAFALLHEGVSTTLITQSIPCLGGLGKTQLVIEFAHCYGRFFHGVHWLNATQPETLPAQIAACGAVMSLPDWPEDLPEQVERTLQAWRQDPVKSTAWAAHLLYVDQDSPIVMQSKPEPKSRLIILDNVQNVTAMRIWLDQLRNDSTKLLITSRRREWPDDLKLRALLLDVFDVEESLTFLQKHLGTEQLSSKDLLALAVRLNYLPIALDLAGRYLAQEQTTLIDYIERLDHAAETRAIPKWQPGTDLPSAHDLNLMAALTLSWDALDDQMAQRLFTLASYCAPNQAIPKELLQQALQAEFTSRFRQRLVGLFKSLPKVAFEESLHRLITLGLIQVQANQPEPLINPVLAELARRQKNAPKLLSGMVDSLTTLGQKVLEIGLPVPFDSLRPHVEAVVIAADQSGLARASELWNHLGAHSLDLGDYPRAWKTYEHALKINERAFGPNHPTVAKCFAHLGVVLRHMGDLPGAKVVYERALSINEQALGPDHPDVAQNVAHLGSILRELGDLKAALTAYERALTINEQSLGLYHSNVAQDVSHIGMVLYESGDLPGARAAHKRALEIEEKVHGPDHPNVAIHANNLGGVLVALGDSSGAYAALEQSLVILKKNLPPGHPSIRQVESNLENLNRYI